MRWKGDAFLEDHLLCLHVSHYFKIKKKKTFTLSGANLLPKFGACEVARADVFMASLLQRVPRKYLTKMGSVALKGRWEIYGYENYLML